MSRMRAKPGGLSGWREAPWGFLPFEWQFMQFSEKPPISLCLSWILAWLWQAQQDQAFVSVGWQVLHFPFAPLWLVGKVWLEGALTACQVPPGLV